MHAIIVGMHYAVHNTNLRFVTNYIAFYKLPLND